MNCTICGKPIKLVPSAKERSEKTGYPASYFTSLFTEHASCALAKREKDTVDLMRRIRNEAIS